MMTLYAPWPGPTVIMKLPNPDLGDGRRPSSTVRLKRGMDGTIYTTVRKRTQSKLYRYSFTLTRLKSLEFLEFVRIYLGQNIRIVWGTLDIVGVIKTNPTELSLDSRAVAAGSLEETKLSLEFETVQ